MAGASPHVEARPDRARRCADPCSAGPRTGRRHRDDAYRRIGATGTFVAGKDSFVQAVTDRGPGWWVLTPLRTTGGPTILINRGYVPDRRTAPPPATRTEVTGLLRISEPGGGFLHANDPAADRWYSRDVAAIARRRGLGPTANYFIDADARAGPGQPVGGLTVIDFPNNHLVYAITWYTLAVMAAAGFLYWVALLRRDRG